MTIHDTLLGTRAESKNYIAFGAMGLQEWCDGDCSPAVKLVAWRLKSEKRAAAVIAALLGHSGDLPRPSPTGCRPLWPDSRFVTAVSTILKFMRSQTTTKPSRSSSIVDVIACSKRVSRIYFYNFASFFIVAFTPLLLCCSAAYEKCCSFRCSFDVGAVELSREP